MCLMFKVWTLRYFTGELACGWYCFLSDYGSLNCLLPAGGLTFYEHISLNGDISMISMLFNWEKEIFHFRNSYFKDNGGNSIFFVFVLVQFSYLQLNGEYLKRIFFRIPLRGPSLRSEKCPIFLFNIYQNQLCIEIWWKKN